MKASILFASLSLCFSVFAQEQQFIDTLQSNASRQEKATACRELARVATSQAVPVLASLLKDPELSHMARYALEPIPDTTVDNALREAIGTVQGPQLIGVISSLAARKDTLAVEPLTRLLANPDPTVAKAAARALGKIGPAAAKSLEEALSNHSNVILSDVCEGILRCAEQLPENEAVRLYSRLSATANLPYEVQVAALRGTVCRRGTAGVPLLLDGLRGKLNVGLADVIRISYELPGTDVTKAFADELLTLNSTDAQLALIQALGYRGGLEAEPALLAMARTGSSTNRASAIRSLVQLRAPSALPILATLVRDSDPVVANAAQAGLFGFPGNAADETILFLVHDSKPELRSAAIDAIRQRRVSGAVAELLKAACSDQSDVAEASFRALGELGSAIEIPELIRAALSTSALGAAESALSAICSRETNSLICVDQINRGIAQAQGDRQSALIRVLGSIGNLPALEAIRNLLKVSSSSVQETTLRTLCDWPTVDALPDLTHILKGNADSKSKILTLRAVLRLIPAQPSGTESLKLAQIKEIQTMADQTEEKRLILAILADIPSRDSLAMVQPTLANEELKEEAGAAAVAIGEKIFKDFPGEVAEAMQQVHTTNTQLSKRTRDLLTRARAAKDAAIK